jgi:hypothetical protein
LRRAQRKNDDCPAKSHQEKHHHITASPHHLTLSPTVALVTPEELELVLILRTIPYCTLATETSHCTLPFLQMGLQ